METSGKGGLGATMELCNMNQSSNRTATDLDLNRMPKVYMYLVQTPPAYKNKQFYRMSITHRFAFRKFRQVYGIDGPNVWSDQINTRYESNGLIDRAVKIAGMKMYDESGRLHSDDFEIPMYEPALENTIEADGEATITKISDGAI